MCAVCVRSALCRAQWRHDAARGAHNLATIDGAEGALCAFSSVRRDNQVIYMPSQFIFRARSTLCCFRFGYSDPEELHGAAHLALRTTLFRARCRSAPVKRVAFARSLSCSAPPPSTWLPKRLSLRLECSGPLDRPLCLPLCCSFGPPHFYRPSRNARGDANW